MEEAVEGKKIRSYKDLLIWQAGMDLVKEVYEATQNFPREEFFSICSEMRRAAVAVPSKIAEGFSFHNKTEFKESLFFALGSVAELETKIQIGRDLNYLSQGAQERCQGIIKKINGMIWNLIKKMDAK